MRRQANNPSHGSELSKDGSRLLVPFGRLGEYRLHVHAVGAAGLGPPVPFNCAIRDREDLLTERIEVHLGEELHARRKAAKEGEAPLLRLDRDGLWIFVEGNGSWMPLRGASVLLDLGEEKEAVVRSAPRV